MSSFHYSIVIPHRDQPVTLRELLCSIPKRPDVQIIVSDDGSLPKHGEALEVIKREFDISWVDKPTGVLPCVGLARNRGIQLASGTYILFADSDDLLKEGLFDELDQVIMSEPEAEVIYFGVEQGAICQEGDLDVTPMEKRNRLMRQAFKKQQQGFYEKMYAFLSRLDTPWAKLIHREKAGNRIYFPNRPVSEDVIQNIQLLDSRPKVAFLIKSGYVKREQPGSLSNILNEDFLKHRFEASLTFHQWIRKKKWKEGYTTSGGYFIKTYKLRSLKIAWSFFIDCLLKRFPFLYPLHRYGVVCWLWALEIKSKEERQFYLITGKWEE